MTSQPKQPRQKTKDPVPLSSVAAIISEFIHCDVSEAFEVHNDSTTQQSFAAMTTVEPGPARVPTPNPKAPPTSSLNPESATASTSRSASSQRPAQEAPTRSEAAPRRGPRSGTSDPLSDRATAFLIRRTLCPQQVDKDRSSPTPIEELLPPLTSRNDVDLQLYALLSIILREFVQNWYSKITTDQTFVAEIVQVIAHCTRALEQRLRKVDMESLLFDEIPDLLNKHIDGLLVPIPSLSRMIRTRTSFGENIKG